MHRTRRLVAVLAALVVPVQFVSAAPAADPTVLTLWPGKPPGEVGSIGPETAKTTDRGGKKVVTNLTNVSTPTLSVYPAPKEHATGVGVVVCPGGGYTNLAWDHEGEQVAAWLNSIGVTAAVLKYRVPRREGTPMDEQPPQALADAQRAVSLVRSRAKDWGLDSARIGVLGFSAGGHLVAWTSAKGDARSYEPVDDADKLTCRPDFTVSVYPGALVKKGTDAVADNVQPTPHNPPTFVIVAADDVGSARNSVLYYLALRKAGVPAELHVFAAGGHGFGMRRSDKPFATWPNLCEDWLRDRQILKPTPK